MGERGAMVCGLVVVLLLYAFALALFARGA